jgi:hypothetical protein
MLPTTRQIAAATLLHRSNSQVAACMVHARQTKEMMVACAATQMFTRQETSHPQQQRTTKLNPIRLGQKPPRKETNTSENRLQAVHMLVFAGAQPWDCLHRTLINCAAQAAPKHHAGQPPTSLAIAGREPGGPKTPAERGNRCAACAEALLHRNATPQPLHPPPPLHHASSVAIAWAWVDYQHVPGHHPKALANCLQVAHTAWNTKLHQTSTHAHHHAVKSSNPQHALALKHAQTNDSNLNPCHNRKLPGAQVLCLLEPGFGVPNPAHHNSAAACYKSQQTRANKHALGPWPCILAGLLRNQHLVPCGCIRTLAVLEGRQQALCTHTHSWAVTAAEMHATP